MCILCDKLRGQVGDDKCMCCSITFCRWCDIDNRFNKFYFFNHIIKKYTFKDY